VVFCKPKSLCNNGEVPQDTTFSDLLSESQRAALERVREALTSSCSKLDHQPLDGSPSTDNDLAAPGAFS